MNKFWTYRSKENILREMARFVIVFLFCYSIQVGVLNFAGNKWIVFGKRSV